MKYYLLFVLLLLSQIFNAQVKKNFYGVPFSTSKEQTKALLTNQKISFKEEWDGIVISFANIGDYFFEKATMCFSEDRFYKISFYKTYGYPFLDKADKMYKGLHQDLSKKYSVLDKKEREGSLSNFTFRSAYEAAFTTIIVRYGRKGTVNLSYCYSTLSGEILLDYYDNEYLSKQRTKPSLKNEL